MNTIVCFGPHVGNFLLCTMQNSAVYVQPVKEIVPGVWFRQLNPPSSRPVTAEEAQISRPLVSWLFAGYGIFRVIGIYFIVGNTNDNNDA